MDWICQTGHESLLNSLWGPFPVRFVQHLPLFAGFWKPVFGKPVFGNRFLETGFRKPVFGNRFLETGFWKPVFANRFLQTGFWKPVFGKPVFGKPVFGNRFLEKFYVFWPFSAVRGSTAHPPGRQVRVLNHWAAARRSWPLSGALPRPGPGAGPGRSPREIRLGR